MSNSCRGIHIIDTEGGAHGWQRRADRVAASRGTVAPYLLGVVDASLVAVGLYHLAALKIDFDRVQSLVALVQSLRS